MQRSSNGGNTAGDQVSVICLHGEIAAEDMFDCIARDIVFLFGFFRPVLFSVVHNYCQHRDGETPTHPRALAQSTSLFRRRRTAESVWDVKLRVAVEATDDFYHVFWYAKTSECSQNDYDIYYIKRFTPI